METLAQYDANLVLTEVSLAWAWIAGDSLELSQSIQAAREAGIPEYHVVITFLNDYGRHPEWRAVDHNMTPVDAVCPTKQGVRDAIDSVVTELVSNYDIDGICFDYIRYRDSDMCYCDECKAKFEEWLGETISGWPGDFAPGGSRQEEFLEWRINPITEIVRDVRTLALSINPNLTLSAAVFPIPWWGDPEWARDLYKWELGQDSADWVAKGYLDYVNPMIYKDGINEFNKSIERCYQYMVEGQNENLVPFITTASPETGWQPLELNLFVQEVELCKEMSGGWIVWKYGGPGLVNDGVDIRIYFDRVTAP